jgi:hypothetical protein
MAHTKINVVLSTLVESASRKQIRIRETILVKMTRESFNPTIYKQAVREASALKDNHII